MEHEGRRQTQLSARSADRPVGLIETVTTGAGRCVGAERRYVGASESFVGEMVARRLTVIRARQPGTDLTPVPVSAVVIGHDGEAR
jgi:hypothetical protein